MKKTIKVRITLIEEMLATASSNKEIHREYIASLAPDAKSTEEEVDALGVDAVDRKGMTVFHRNANAEPILFDYHIKGAFKDACGMLNRVPETLSGKLKAYKKVIDGTIFVNPRQIVLMLPEGSSIGRCDRPLIAQTAQGQRVALASSETVPAGTVFEVAIDLLDGRLEPVVLEWLEYMQLRGFGAWRNSGKGKASCRIL